MKNLFLIALCSLFMTSAFAEAPATQEVGEAQLSPILMPEEFTVKSGDTKIIPLPHFMFIDRMTFEVKTSLFCKKDSFRVAFDGYSAQSVWLDGGLKGFRNKIVMAQVSTRTLEFTNTTECQIKVKNMQVLPRRFNARPGNCASPLPCGGNGPVYMPASEAGAQVSYLIETFQYLGDLATDADRIQFITPMKRTAGKALAVLNSAPETSQAALRAIQEVIRELKRAQPFIEKLATVEATFEIAQEIQSVEAALERMVR